jgi:hypothetical protein
MFGIIGIILMIKLNKESVELYKRQKCAVNIKRLFIVIIR